VRPLTDDDGFSLIESLVSLALIGAVMSAATSLFASSVRVTNHQSNQEVGVWLAESGVEITRGDSYYWTTTAAGVTNPLKTSPASAAAPTEPATVVNGLTYSRRYATTAPAVGLRQIRITVSWPCQTGTCGTSATTLVSVAADPTYAP